MENKILVTGGYGLVGSEFIKENYIKISSSDIAFFDTNDTASWEAESNQ